MSERWRRIRASELAAFRPCWALLACGAAASSSSLTGMSAGGVASFFNNSTMAAAGMTNERVRSARAVVIPTTRPCRSTTGPPIWLGLGRMSVWMAWVKESRTSLIAPPMRSMYWMRLPDIWGIFGRLPNTTSTFFSPSSALTRSVTFSPGVVPVRAFFRASRPETVRSPTLRMTFPGFNPAASAPEPSATSLILTPCSEKPISPTTPRNARSVSRRFRSATLTTPKAASLPSGCGEARKPPSGGVSKDHSTGVSGLPSTSNTARSSSA